MVECAGACGVNGFACGVKPDATFCNMDGGDPGRNEPNPVGCDIGPPGDANHLDGAPGIGFVCRFRGALVENGGFCHPDTSAGFVPFFPVYPRFRLWLHRGLLSGRPFGAWVRWLLWVVSGLGEFRPIRMSALPAGRPAQTEVVSWGLPWGGKGRGWPRLWARHPWVHTHGSVAWLSAD